MLTLLSRGTRRWWRREWWCGCGAKARTDHRKSTRKHALRKYGPRFFNDVELHATFPIVFHVGRGLGPGNTREKGVLLLETTLDVYKRKLVYQVHREHRFINVSTDEVGQLFFIVFPALINIFFLSFFFCAFIDVNMLIYRMKNTYCKTCVKFSIYFAYNKFKFIQNYKYNFDFA